MKQDWLIRLELQRFYDKKKELRARVEKGKLKDKILFAVYSTTMEQDFSLAEIKRALKLKLIEKQQVRSPTGAIRTIYCWTEDEAKYQPVRYKRVLGKVIDWVMEKIGR